MNQQPTHNFFTFKSPSPRLPTFRSNEQNRNSMWEGNDEINVKQQQKRHPFNFTQPNELERHHSPRNVGNNPFSKSRESPSTPFQFTKLQKNTTLKDSVSNEENQNALQTKRQSEFGFFNSRKSQESFCNKSNNNEVIEQNMKVENEELNKQMPFTPEYDEPATRPQTSPANSRSNFEILLRSKQNGVQLSNKGNQKLKSELNQKNLQPQNDFQQFSEPTFEIRNHKSETEDQRNSPMNSNNYLVGSHFNETPKEAIIPPPSPLQQQQTVELNQSSMNIDQEPPMNQIFLDPNEMDTQEFKKLVQETRRSLTKNVSEFDSILTMLDAKYMEIEKMQSSLRNIRVGLCQLQVQAYSMVVSCMASISPTSLEEIERTRKFGNS